MTPTKIEEIRARIDSDDGMHTYDDGCGEAESDRRLLLNEVDRLRKVLERISTVAERAHNAGEDRTAQLWDIAENAL